MSESMDRSRGASRTFGAAAGGAVVGVVAAALLLSPGEARSDRGEVIEYAELALRGIDAVFVSETRTLLIEGDEDFIDTVRTENDPSLSVARPSRLYHLNRVGAEGWEIVDVFPGQGRETFLLQRGAFEGVRRR